MVKKSKATLKQEKEATGGTANACGLSPFTTYFQADVIMYSNVYPYPTGLGIPLCNRLCNV